MTDNDLIQQAQALTGRGLKRLTPRHKLLIGRALLIGKAENAALPDFGKWRRANGFGDLNRNDMQDFMWLAENAHFEWFQEFDFNSVRAARQAWEAEQGKDLNRYDRIEQVLKGAPPEGMAMSGVLEAVAADQSLARDAHKRLSEMVGNGRAVRPSRGHYRLPNEQEHASLAAEQVKQQEQQEQATGNPQGWSTLTRSGFGDVLRKVKKWVHQAGQTAPFSRSTDKKARVGTTVESFFPAEGENYRDAVESSNVCKRDLIEVPFTSIPDRSKGEEEKTWEEPILGWVKGYRARVVVDPVWIPVDRKFQSRPELYKPRKEGGAQ